jgi:1-acyl-sn-glycerol-3-phosphate acyltransferase
MNLSTAHEAFSADTYETPAHTRRYVGDRIFLHSRWWLYLRFAGVVIKSRRLSVKGQYDDEAWLESSFRILKHIEGCGGRFHITGLDNLRKTAEPLVIVSNHMSTLETLIFPCLIVPSRPITFVVKESLVKGPVFGPIMKSRNPITVSRSNPWEDFRAVLNQGKEILAHGKSLVVFPQSTRTRDFNPVKFNTLGVKLAKNTGVKIVPTAIKTDFWGESKLIKGFGPLHREKTIHITFGEPMTVNGSGKEEHQQIIRFIISHLDRWTHGEKIEGDKLRR